MIAKWCVSGNCIEVFPYDETDEVGIMLTLQGELEYMGPISKEKAVELARALLQKEPNDHIVVHAEYP